MRIIVSLSTYYKIYYKEKGNRILQAARYDLIRTAVGTNTTRQAAPIVLLYSIFSTFSVLAFLFLAVGVGRAFCFLWILDVSRIKHNIHHIQRPLFYFPLGQLHTGDRWGTWTYTA